MLLAPDREQFASVGIVPPPLTIIPVTDIDIHIKKSNRPIEVPCVVPEIKGFTKAKAG